jgi:hypothetical protein
MVNSDEDPLQHENLKVTLIDFNVAKNLRISDISENNGVNQNYQSPE